MFFKFSEKRGGGLLGVKVSRLLTAWVIEGRRGVLGVCELWGRVLVQKYQEAVPFLEHHVRFGLK